MNFLTCTESGLKILIHYFFFFSNWFIKQIYNTEGTNGNIVAGIRIREVCHHQQWNSGHRGNIISLTTIINLGSSL